MRAAQIIHDARNRQGSMLPYPVGLSVWDPDGSVEPRLVSSSGMSATEPYTTLSHLLGCSPR